ncbi:MAG: hypothetical protein EOM24_10060 [Chloroflexia bacterium]|nr:hypothetical protein [Chloroflexia bacterium]
MSDLLTQASEQFTRCCIEAPRYRVGWLLGPPQRSRKTLLAQQLCEHNGWHYLDYTGTPGYFDALADCIDAYQPTQFVTAIRGWSKACTAPVLVLDEIDALLATWDRTQRRNWAGLVARLPYLSCGLIIVSHFFTLSELQHYLPDGDARYCLELPGD